MSQFTERKAAFCFDQMDADGDGYLSRDDYLFMAGRAAGGFGYPSASADARKIRERYLDLWHKLLAPMDTDADGRISRSEYASAVAGLASDPVVYQDSMGAAVDAFIGAADPTDSGRLDVDALARLFQYTFKDIEPDETAEIFKRLDLDQDGFLDRPELSAAIHTFFSSEDTEAAGNWFMGNPVRYL